VQRILIKSSVIILATLLLSACGSGGRQPVGVVVQSDFQHAHAQVVTPTAPNLQNCAISADSAQPDTSWAYDYQMDIALVHPSGQCLPASTKVSYTIYGYDRYIADVSATVLGQWLSVPVHSGDFFRIGLQVAAFNDIEYQSGAPDAFAYYSSIEVDSNGDGKICNGDLAQDYDARDFMSYPFSQTYLIQTMRYGSDNIKRDGDIVVRHVKLPAHKPNHQLIVMGSLSQVDATIIINSANQC